MKKKFSPVCRKHYFEGYSIGSNPYLEYNDAMQNDAFIIGFKAGREEYVRMNGSMCYGIPERIVTIGVLEDFLIAGLLGLPIDDEGYTVYQLSMIEEWYQSGIEKYEPKHSNTLFELLEKSGIQIS